jgi:hypothetical protein
LVVIETRRIDLPRHGIEERGDKMPRVMLLLSVLSLSAASASATINIEWRPLEASVEVGGLVHIGLFAVSDDLTEQSIASVDLLAGWDPQFLELQGNIDDGPYTWYWSMFPDDSAGDGMNDTWLDGDAKYTALSQFGAGNEAMATPEGLLVTTLEFVALQETPVDAPTELITIPSYGEHSETVIRPPGGGDVTGELSDNALITIVPEPAAGLLILAGALALLWRRGRGRA